MLLNALSRYDVANYVDTLFVIYIILLFAYILTNLLISFGMRPAYSRYVDMVLGFLRDVSEPYLRIFRRFLPPMGGIDLSPMLAIFLLYIARTLIVNAING